MRHIISVIIFIVLLSGTIVVALNEAGFGGYSGYAGTQRRLDDPYSRQQYFGEYYERQFVNFGSKGPSYRILNTGSTSAFSSVFNLDTNTYTNQGRNPGRISNFDPNMRGFARLDRSVDLLPFEGPNTIIQGQAVYGKGTARIVSVGDAFGQGLNKAGPRTQVFISVTDLPPIGEGLLYEAWLVDEDSGYSLSLGSLVPSVKLTFSGFIEFQRKVEMFESVMVTVEQYPDFDPTPGEVVLWGDIGVTRTALSTSTSLFEDRLR
ncbi:anti-sigma factor [Candidatus Woesearchaeota archaeon]|nr:anti-sigma factor [Candidatus Woesearchaeota archaeon]